MKRMNNGGFSLSELIMALALISIISLSAVTAFKTNKEGLTIVQNASDNQTAVKGALKLITFELRNCRDLLMPTDTIIWPRNSQVDSTFLSFQKNKSKIAFSADFSTVTYRLENDTLYRYEHYNNNLSKKVLLNNLVPNDPIFHLLYGDVKTTRNISISLLLKTFGKRPPKSFKTTVFVLNPPKMGANIYDLP